MPLAVFALALAAFCIGSTEFIVSGILLSHADRKNPRAAAAEAGL